MSDPQHQQASGGEEGEGTWIYSYADMVSLLFCFFVLMYAATADREKVKQISKILSEGLGGSQNLNVERTSDSADERALRAFQMLSSMLDLGDSVEDAVGNIERKFAATKNAETFKQELSKNPEAQKALEGFVQMGQMGEDRLVSIVIPTDFAFDSGEASLREETYPLLKTVVESIQDMVQQGRIEVLGHSDDVPLRNLQRWQSNWELSAARAAAVGSKLRELGIPGERMMISGVAEYQPQISPKGLSGLALEAARKQNRRVEIRILQGGDAQAGTELKP
jgi:chemotaxis protein MotB